MSLVMRSNPECDARPELSGSNCGEGTSPYPIPSRDDVRTGWPPFVWHATTFAPLDLMSEDHRAVRM